MFLGPPHKVKNVLACVLHCLIIPFQIGAVHEHELNGENVAELGHFVVDLTLKSLQRGAQKIHRLVVVALQKLQSGDLQAKFGTFNRVLSLGRLVNVIGFLIKSKSLFVALLHALQLSQLMIDLPRLNMTRTQGPQRAHQRAFEQNLRIIKMLLSLLPIETRHLLIDHRMQGMKLAQMELQNRDRPVKGLQSLFKFILLHIDLN